MARKKKDEKLKNEVPIFVSYCKDKNIKINPPKKINIAPINIHKNKIRKLYNQNIYGKDINNTSEQKSHNPINLKITKKKTKTNITNYIHQQ